VAYRGILLHDNQRFRAALVIELSILA